MVAIKRAGLVLLLVVGILSLASMACSDIEVGTGENGQSVTVKGLPAEVGAAAAGTVRDVGTGIVAARDAVAADTVNQLFGGGQ